MSGARLRGQHRGLQAQGGEGGGKAPLPLTGGWSDFVAWVFPCGLQGCLGPCLASSLVLGSSLLCGLSGSQHVRDVRRSQRAKPVPWCPWGPRGRLPSSAPWRFWAAPFHSAACSSVWNVPAPWRKPALWDAFIPVIPRGPYARPAHAASWTAAPRSLPWAATNDLPWAVTNAASWAAPAAGAKLPSISRVRDRHPCRAPISGECQPCATLSPSLAPKAQDAWPSVLPARPGGCGWRVWVDKPGLSPPPVTCLNPHPRLLFHRF